MKVKLIFKSCFGFIILRIRNSAFARQNRSTAKCIEKVASLL